jgi:ubiquinone/menaquinone biosynthesis C-methylase UbiE
VNPRHVMQVTDRLLRVGRVGTNHVPARIEWIAQTLRNLPSGQRILDAGAGELQFKKYCSHLKYVAQDFAKYDGVGDRRGLTTGRWDQTGLDIVSDITSIPEPDESFDAIMCIEVFEHLPNPILAIREFARLLRPGGQLIVTAPFCSLTHFAPFHFCTGFSRYFYQTHLANHRFEIIELQENGNYFEYFASELRRVPDIAARYTAARLRVWELFALGVVLKMFQRLNNHDQGSAEVLHVGCHVRAVKLGA